MTTDHVHIPMTDDAEVCDIISHGYMGGKSSRMIFDGFSPLK